MPTITTEATITTICTTTPSPGEACAAADGAASAAGAAAGAAGGACPAAPSGRPFSPPCANGPANGYEVMHRLEEMSGGLWRPSPGSVYPHLQMLEDEGLVQSSEVDGGRAFTLTETGQAEAEKAKLPWQEAGETDNEVRTLRLGMGQLMSAAKQLAGDGEKSQIERGISVIQKARKELYGILAED